MPAIKSPAKLLKLWDKAKADYLKVNQVEELEPKEEVLFVRTSKGLTRLRKLAQRNGAEDDSEDFLAARAGLLESMQKFRKLFKPKKDRPPVKKYYQALCRLILCVEQLGGTAELDASEEEPSENVLDDLDAEGLDQRDTGAAEHDEAAPPPTPAAAPVPPTDEAAVWRQQAKAVEPELMHALRENRGDTNRIRAVFAYAREKAGHHDYAHALQGLGALRQLLHASPPAQDTHPGAAAPEETVVNPADTESLRFNERLPTLIPKILQAQQAFPEGHQALLRQVNEAHTFQRQREYAKANAKLDQVETLVREALGHTPPAQESAPAAAPAAPDAVPTPAHDSPPTSSLPIWQEAKDQVGRQLGQLQARLREANDPDLQLIADRGLHGITGRLQVGMMAALMDLDRSTGEARAQARARAHTLIVSWQQFLQGNALIRLLDDNPFGVSVSIRQTLTTAFDDIARIVGVQ